MSNETIPQHIKADLRSVLSAASGTPQSKIGKEYNDLIGEPLNVSEYGYQNLYDFLLALEGEFCRMEFSPKHCDNMVYAVLDPSKFSSLHAQKYASKGTGIPHKTPEEIFMLGGPIGPKGKNNNKNNNRNRFQPVPRTQVQQVPLKAPVIPNVSDWNLLNKLSCNSKGEFALYANVKSLSEGDIRNLFRDYNPCFVRISKMKDKRLGIVSFKTYTIAFNAWSHASTNPKLMSLGVEPFIDREMKWLNSSYKILINNIPFGKIYMTAIVKLLTRFTLKDELLMVETRMNYRQALAYYKTKDVALEYCKIPQKMTDINGHNHIVQISFLEEPQKQSFASINSQITRNAGPPLSTSSHLPLKTQSPPQSSLEQSNSSKSLTQAEEKSPVSEEKEPINKYADKRCGFPLDFTAAENMFSAACKRSARTARNVNDDIQFVVTYYEDGCRFWVLVIDHERSNFQKLMDLQAKLVASASKVQPPSMKPKRGSKGAALYNEGNESESGTWYRCYVMDEGDEDSDTITVFFVDYGNVERVKTQDFRNTYPEFWRLPPQAIPCKLHGVEVKHNLSGSQRNDARQQLMSILSGQDMLKANVIKDADYSQPHIIELSNVRSTTDADVLNVDELCSFGLLCRIGEDHIEEDSLDACYDQQREGAAVDEASKTSISMFQYDPKELIFGMVSEVHNANLIYLLLGDFNIGVNALESSLHQVNLSKKRNPVLKKGDLFIAQVESIRRRVLVLEVKPETDKVKVLHVDYGKIEWLKSNQLYHLDESIRKQPFQARPAALVGLKCKSKIQVVKFLKTFVRKLIRAHIVRETEFGKLFVELFDNENGKSLNLDLIERGLAEQESLAKQDRLEDTASVISVPTSSSTVGNADANLSGASFSSRTNSEIEAAMGLENSNEDLEKDATVKQWLDSNTVMESDKTESAYRPHTPPGQPPDIVSSNIVKDPVKLADGIRLEGRKILLGFGDDIDELTLNEENKLVSSEVDALRAKWLKEKDILEGVRGTLQGMLLLSPAELKEKFKEKRKEKLRMMVEMKQMREQLKKIENEYEQVVAETEILLSAI